MIGNHSAFGHGASIPIEKVPDNQKAYEMSEQQEVKSKGENRENGINRGTIISEAEVIFEREIFRLKTLDVSIELPAEEIILSGTYEPNSSFEINGIKYYTDDSGKVYRIGDDLRPGITYEINGYIYKTDNKGRIISAEGILQKKDHEGRPPIKDGMDKVGKGDQKDTDDRGHLIGDQFNGGNGLENLVPMDAELNRGDFKKLENMLADAVDDGAEVYVKVEPVYEGDSNRPIGFRVTYTINGETDTVYFKNGSDS